MTGEPSNAIQGDSRRRRLTSDAATSEALEQMHTFAHRALLLSLGCVLLLALTSTLARAASSATPSKFSASLTVTAFVASQTRSVKLTTKFPKPSSSYSYRLGFGNLVVSLTDRV